MSRIDSGSSPFKLSNLVKAATDVISKATAKPAKPEVKKRADGFTDKHVPSLTESYEAGKSKQAQLKKLATGAGKLNADGSTTTTTERKKKGATTKQEVTTSREKFTGKTKLKSETTVTEKSGRETKAKFNAETDVLRRATSTQSREVTTKKGDKTTVESKSTAVDAYGNKQVTKGKTTSVEKGNTTTSDARSTVTGAFNTSQTVAEHKTVVKDGDHTTTRTTKDSKGSTFALSNGVTEFKDGKFTLKDSADWKKQSFNKEKGTEHEWKLKDVPTPDAGFTQKKTTGVQSKLDKAKIAGDIAGAAGLKKTLVETPKFDTAKLSELEAEKAHFVGSKVGTNGETKVTVGANGVDAVYKRGASAGLYAQHNDSVEGTHGKASYQAGAKLEAKANVDAQGKLNLNGLDASVSAKVGVSAEASIKGKLESKPLMKLGGVDITASAEGSARVAAEAEAHVDGKAKFTRNPPAAILEGSAGASAVVKAEADVKVAAGPFSVKASGYASAGAEAKASGVIGYQDGKLKLGGSLGAALGVGLGGSVNVEVDVAQIGTMAKKAADQNGDGKLGLDDVTAGAKNLGHAAMSGVSSAASTVRSWLPW